MTTSAKPTPTPPTEVPWQETISQLKDFKIQLVGISQNAEHAVRIRGTRDLLEKQLPSEVDKIISSMEKKPRHTRNISQYFLSLFETFLLLTKHISVCIEASEMETVKVHLKRFDEFYDYLEEMAATQKTSTGRKGRFRRCVDSAVKGPSFASRSLPSAGAPSTATNEGEEDNNSHAPVDKVASTTRTMDLIPEDEVLDSGERSIGMAEQHNERDGDPAASSSTKRTSFLVASGRSVFTQQSYKTSNRK